MSISSSAALDKENVGTLGKREHSGMGLGNRKPLAGKRRVGGLFKRSGLLTKAKIVPISARQKQEEEEEELVVDKVEEEIAFLSIGSTGTSSNSHTASSSADLTSTSTMTPMTKPSISKTPMSKTPMTKTPMTTKSFGKTPGKTPGTTKKVRFGSVKTSEIMSEPEPVAPAVDSEEDRREKEMQEMQELKEKERIERERAERLEKERAEEERLEKERLEKERLEKERLEKERLEKERLELERIDMERQRAERQKDRMQISLDEQKIQRKSLRKRQLHDFFSRLNKSVRWVDGAMFALGRAIGAGGTSKVYEATDEDMRSWALKMVDLKGMDDNTREGMLHEIQVLESLRGVDRVVHLKTHEVVHDARKDADILYIVMEKGDTDLASILRGIVPSPTLQFYFRGMVEAVDAIHDHNVVHTDLKPANFILVGGVTKLIDFGIANTISEDTTNILRETQIGTINFIPPEALKMVNGKIKLGRSSDVWSLGCILHKMMFGKPLFEGGMAQKITQITSTEEIDFSRLKQPVGMSNTVFTDVMDVLKACLRRAPKERPTTKELLAHPFLN